jgi:mono/diheme cytochrome c family protein
MRTAAVRLRMSRIALLMFVSVFAFAMSRAAAQENGAAAAENPKWNYDELTRAPEKAQAKPNPLEGDPDAIRAGGKLFEQHCSECHGMKAEGGRRGPSLLRNEVAQATPGTLFWLLTNGVVWHGMPVWSRLPEPQRWQIVAFIGSFRTSPGRQEPTGGR